jgi:hypothetical protein
MSADCTAGCFAGFAHLLKSDYIIWIAALLIQCEIDIQAQNHMAGTYHG